MKVVFMKVRLFNEEDVQGKGKVPAGTIIEHKDAHWLIKLGKAEEVKEQDEHTESDK
jgi:hypothetical protein